MADCKSFRWPMTEKIIMFMFEVFWETSFEPWMVEDDLKEWKDEDIALKRTEH